MTGTDSVNPTIKGLLAGSAVVLVAAGGFAAWHFRSPPAQPAMKMAASQAAGPAMRANPAATTPAASPAAAATPAAPTGPMTGPCAAPSAAPPHTPDGATATVAQMAAARDLIQTYVNALESYQACLNRAADTVTEASPATRQSWVDHGNGAIDEANLLAAAFAASNTAFHAAHPGVTLPPK